MIALIIIAAVVLLIVLLMNFPAYAYIRFYSGEPDIKVKYLWLTLYPKKENPPKKSRGKAPPDEKKDDEDNSGGKEDTSPPPDSGSTEDKTSSDKPSEKAKRASGKSKDKKAPKEPFLQRINTLVDGLTEKKDAFLLLWELCGGHLKKLGGKIRIDDIRIDFAAADEDAHNAAILYGELNAAVYNVLAVIRQFISISIISVNIDCLFNTPSEKSRYDGECKIKLRPASLLNALAAIVFGYIGNIKKYSPALDAFMKKKS